MRFGTRLDRDDSGRLVRVIDRGGRIHAELVWEGDQLVRLDVAGLTVSGRIVRDPLLGEAHVVGETMMSAVDWQDPRWIPTIAAPGKLPPGGGAALLNVLALLADRPLRYAGPYPTPALFRALSRSFHTTATEDEFCSDAVGRAARLATDELPFDFTPAPHERVAFGRGHVELRDTLERAVIRGIAYERGVTRLVADEAPEPTSASHARAPSLHAEVWFGDAAYARVASFAPDGALIDGPHAIPPCTSDALGKPFPAQLTSALGELVADAVPPPLAVDVARLVAASPMVWADLGAQAARYENNTFEVHAALWDRLAPHGLTRLALALAEALAPVAAQTVLAHVTA